MSRSARLGRALVAAAALGLWPGPLRAQSAPPPGAGAGDSAETRDHAAHAGGQTTPATRDADPEDHSTHGSPPAQPAPGIAPITDADRAAAFPDVEGHAVHDTALNYYVLFDQLEWLGGGGSTGGSWDTKGWIGGDRDRFWFRTEGSGLDGRLGNSQTHLMYGRAIARWWDLVVGIRQDVRPGPAQTWAAIGVQGLAPYWFDVEATAYVGASGRTHVRFEVEYEMLLTNRLVLQPLVELEIYGKADPEHEMGAGLSTADAGLRLRYELRREIAPYVGVSWSRKFFGTADLAEAAGARHDGARVAVGLRVWF
jgi:copper resistance protein B